MSLTGLRTLPAVRPRRGEVPPPVEHRGRVVLLPHAGGAANWFRPWGPAMPDWHVVGVQYPGREDLLPVPAYRRLGPMADDVAGEVGALAADGVPTVLLGHSMGAAIAHEVALRLQGTAHPPAALVVSARPGPARVRPGRNLHLGDDDALRAFLTAQGGTPQELERYPDLMAMVFGILRADLELLETSTPDVAGVVTVPVLALGGSHDGAADAQDLAAWADVAGAGFASEVFSGGHFYLQEHRDAVITRLRALLPVDGEPLTR